MSDLVAPARIETIVGVPRHEHHHYGRAVSAEQTVYILHSETCRKVTDDLRDCTYSVALDRGIDPAEWTEDEPLRLTVTGGRLVPDDTGDYPALCLECGEHLPENFAAYGIEYHPECAGIDPEDGPQ